jgi:hypothetical protein
MICLNSETLHVENLSASLFFHNPKCQTKVKQETSIKTLVNIISEHVSLSYHIISYDTFPAYHMSNVIYIYSYIIYQYMIYISYQYIYHIIPRFVGSSNQSSSPRGSTGPRPMACEEQQALTVEALLIPFLLGPWVPLGEHMEKDWTVVTGTKEVIYG